MEALLEALLEAAPATVFLRANAKRKEVNDAKELEVKKTGTRTR